MDYTNDSDTIVTQEMKVIEEEMERENLMAEEQRLMELPPSAGLKAGQLDDLLAKATIYSEFLSQSANLDAISKEASSKAPNVSFSQPPAVTGGQLRNYQLAGVQWLLGLWQNGLNGILAGIDNSIQTTCVNYI